MYHYIYARKTYSLATCFLHGSFFLLYGIVKYLPSPLGDVLRYVVIKFFVNKIGTCKIAEGVTLWFPRGICIGNNVTLNEWVYLSGYGKIDIGNHVRIGHRTSILSSNHNYQDPHALICDQPLSKGRVHIEDDVWIGCNVTILPGLTIGRGSVIGAGSVVTKSIPPYSIAVGIPATVIKSRITETNECEIH